jgi:hypothetical protein
MITTMNKPTLGQFVAVWALILTACLGLWALVLWMIL